MHEIRRSALLPYSAGAVYQLINDIEAYPHFMEGCVGAEVLNQQGDVVEARLDLSKAGIQLSFVTRNELIAGERVALSLVDGPFETLQGEWHVKALSDAACKVSLELRFALRSRLVGAATRTLFNSVANNLVDAVSTRAKDLYG